MSFDEKSSAWRYLVYCFPTKKKVSVREEADLHLFLKELLTRTEINRVITTLKVIHQRDGGRREALFVVGSLLQLTGTQ